MLTIPENVWLLMLDAFTTFPSGHERVAYLDGVRHRGPKGHHAIATTVTVPDAVTSPGNFSVGAEAMERAGDHFAALGLVRLMQVHTHRNDYVEHSPVDDARAYSQRDGALSVVLPHHGVGYPWPWQAGVHVRELDGWRRLHGDEINEVLRVIPAIIDHRRPSWSTYPTATPETSTVSSHPSRQPSRSQWLSWLRQRLRR